MCQKFVREGTKDRSSPSIVIYFIVTSHELQGVLNHRQLDRLRHNEKTEAL